MNIDDENLPKNDRNDNDEDEDIPHEPTETDIRPNNNEDADNQGFSLFSEYEHHLIA